MHTITIKLPDAFDRFVKDRFPAARTDLRDVYAIGLIVASLQQMGAHDLAAAVATVNGCPLMPTIPPADPTSN